MERRKALKHIAIITTGAAFLPACQIESVPAFSNIPLDLDQYQFMKWLTDAILPKGGDPTIETPESTADFVLTMVNDCYPPEEIEEYFSGLRLFKQYILDEYGMEHAQLNPEQQILSFTEVSNTELVPESMKLFLDTTKNLCVRHFTSSAYFLENHAYWKFIPGHFNGCVPLEMPS